MTHNTAAQTPASGARAPGSQTMDDLGRVVSYMRLSVTDHCDFNCFYCRVKTTPLLSHRDILRYEEMTTLAKLARRMGITKLRLTGGEPLLRPGFPDFLGMLAKAVPDMDLRITTNGARLAEHAAMLAGLGVKRINVSLDTLDRATFEAITGRDKLDQVLAGIEKCLDLGMYVKINVVALKNINAKDLPGFVDLAMTKPVDVRFIEFMPLGQGTAWREEQFWSAPEILLQAGKYAELAPVENRDLASGPARLYSLSRNGETGAGRIGVISPLTNHFCDTCNRLRVTSDGRLRTCLFSDKEYRLKPLLRNPKLGPDMVLKVMRLAIKRKPLGYKLLKQRLGNEVCAKAMTSIGG